jgi:hypothetical protein
MAAAMTLEAETSDALAVQRTLPDDALRIAASASRRTTRLAATAIHYFHALLRYNERRPGGLLLGKRHGALKGDHGEGFRMP